MATPTIREVISAGQLFSAGATLTLTTGAGTAVNDLLVCIHGCDDGGTPAGMAAPTGTAGTWTLRTTGSGTGPDYPHMKVWTRPVTVAGAQTVTVDQNTGGDDIFQALYVLAGNSLAVDGAAGGGGSPGASHVAPAVSPAGANNLLICAWIVGFDGTTNYVIPGSMTPRSESDVAPYSTMATASQALAASGSTGTRTATSGNTTSRYASASIAISAAETNVSTADPVPAQVEVSAPTDESVEALSIHVDLVDPVPAQVEGSSPADEVVSVEVPDFVPAQWLLGSHDGDSVAVTIPSDGPGQLVASSPSGEDVVTEEPGLPAGGAPHVTLWIVDGANLVPLPHTLKVDLSPLRNAPGAFTFEYPMVGRNFDLLRAAIQDQRRRVEIEMWVGGRRFNAMRGDVLQYSVDDVSERGVASFSGHFLEWRMTDARLAHDPADEKGEVHFGAATPGQILAQLMAAAQARGTLTDINYSSFSGALDSNGDPWTFNATLKFTPYKTTYLGVLNRLVALGMCEWEIDLNRKLHLHNPGGRGRDLTLRQPPVRLRRAVSLTESQRRIDLRDVGTDLYGTGGEGLFASAVDPSARARLGAQIERDVDSNNLDQQAALAAFVQNTLPTVTEPVVELTHGLVFGSNQPAPVSGFRVGDWLYSDVGRGLERVRVVQWVLSQDVSGVTGSVTLNDTIGDRISRLQRQLDALSDGSAVVGTSEPPPQDDTLAPAAPTGVTADSQAYTDGAGTAATLLVGWTPVTLNADGTPATDVSGYRVEWRHTGDTANAWRLGRIQTGGTAASTSFGGVAAGVSVRVRVAAYDYNGNTSAWSSEVQLVTQTDNTPPPVPSTPTASDYLGVLICTWNGLGSVGEVMPADFSHVEVHVSTASNFIPTSATLVDRLHAAGRMPVADLPYGVTHYFRLVAVDRTTPVANKSAASGQASAVPAKVVSDDVFDGAIGSAKLADLAVITAKIDNLAVNDAKFGSGSIGKLTAGTLSVALLNAGIIRTATTGGRTEQDGAGFRLYNPVDTLVTELRTSDGAAVVTGEYRTALSGERIVLNPDNTSQNEIRFYPETGSRYAKLVANTSSTGGSTRTFIRLRGYDYDPGYAPYVTVTEDFADVTVGAIPTFSNPSPTDFNRVEVTNNGIFLRGNRGTGFIEVNANGGLRSAGYYGFGLSSAKIAVDNGPLFRIYYTGSTLNFINTDTNLIVKTFVIDHPADRDRHLVHATTESPHNGVEYWGVTVVEDGEARVQLPGYFEALCADEGRAVLLTAVAPGAAQQRPARRTPRKPRRTFKQRRDLRDSGGMPTGEFEEFDEPEPLPAADGVPLLSATYPRNGQFRIVADGTVPETIEVAWLVKAIRRDVPVLTVEPRKADVTVRGDGPYRYLVPA